MKDQLKQCYEKLVKFNMGAMKDLGSVEPVFNFLLPFLKNIIANFCTGLCDSLPELF
jgi:hypothetical protein